MKVLLIECHVEYLSQREGYNSSDMGSTDYIWIDA
jgi:hypothetical protein